MEIKHNDATRNRPQGSRVLDAPYVFADLPEYIKQVKDEKTWEKSDRNAITIFKTDNMTIVLSAMKEAAVIKDNQVNGYLTIQVVNGHICMKTLEEETKMKAGQLIAIHPNLVHSIEALTSSVLLISTYDVKNETSK